MNITLLILEAFGWQLTFDEFMDGLFAIIGMLAIYFLKRIFDKMSGMSDKLIIHEEKHVQAEGKFRELTTDIHFVKDKVQEHEVEIARLKV